MSKICESYAPPKVSRIPEVVALPQLEEDSEDKDPIKCSSSIIDTINDTASRKHSPLTSNSGNILNSPQR